MQQRNWMGRGLRLGIGLCLLALIGGLSMGGPVGAQTGGPTPTPAVGGGSGPQLSITDAVAPNQVPAGTKVSYTITVSNIGTAEARDVVLTHTLPDALDFSAVNRQGSRLSANGRQTTLQLGTLAPGQLVVVTVSAVVRAGTAAGSVLRDMALAVGSNAAPVQAQAPLTVVSALLPKSGTGFDLWPVVLGALLAALLLGGLATGRQVLAGKK